LPDVPVTSCQSSPPLGAPHAVHLVAIACCAVRSHRASERALHCALVALCHVPSGPAQPRLGLSKHLAHGVNLNKNPLPISSFSFKLIQISKFCI
jgi:hypothetical protein